MFGKMNYRFLYMSAFLFRNNYNMGQPIFIANFGKIMKRSVSLSHRSYIANNISTSHWKHHHEEQITRIIRQLVQSKKRYKIYGYSKRSCQECQSEWKSKSPYTKESLEDYLKESSNELLNELCEKCNEMKPISSFLLYKKSPLEDHIDIKPTIEIKLSKEWNNYYRVFGTWKCQRCSNRWKSAHTYISLQKFIEKSRLDKDDFYMQKCKNCEEENNDNCVISSYKPLNKSDRVRDTPHEAGLCAKCLSGAYCVHDTFVPVLIINYVATD
ncbi:hypothetical protein GLOIN_2v1652797 [Rhizophagus irregularis DAOM 181602=DAOM 197198]|nr:hypothetical protein GLOIN_2v1652797 [Rhizophagus irregularis DAOM 181602=DAOM 197198]